MKLRLPFGGLIDAYGNIGDASPPFFISIYSNYVEPFNEATYPDVNWRRAPRSNNDIIGTSNKEQEASLFLKIKPIRENIFHESGNADMEGIFIEKTILATRFIDGKQIITSDHGTKMDYVPQSVIVLGGGVIGCEFASVWKSFGAEVTIIEGLPHLIALEDESSSKQLERAFRKRGINFELGVKFKSVVKDQRGVTITLEDGKEFSAEVLMVAVGRGPVSANLGYEEQGITMDRGYVIVDNKCRTNVPGIWAVGDLIPTLQLAHVGFAEGMLVAEEIAGLNPRPINYDGIPRVTYSDPEVASVGLTTAQAKERGHDVVELSYDLAGNGKAQILGTAGSIKLVGEKDGPILGVHMVGARVGELLAEAELIFNWQAHATDVASLIHAHPTLSEAMGEAHMALAGKPLHAHG